MKHAEARRGDLFVACLLPLRGRRFARWLGRQTFRVPACFGRDGVPRKDAECRARTSEEKSYHVHCRAEECDWDHGGQHGRVPLSMSCSLVRVATNRRAQDHDGGRWREEHHNRIIVTADFVSYRLSPPPQPLRALHSLARPVARWPQAYPWTRNSSRLARPAIPAPVRSFMSPFHLVRLLD